LGTEFIAECSKCDTRFHVREGGGFTVHLLHCSECGKEKLIELKDLGEIHSRYVKGLDTPYSSFSANADRDIQENYSGSPITEEQYHLEIERIAGKCSCEGHYKINAKAKCPKCHSDNYKVADGWSRDYD
jgi:DNA-directed RNA polymerase subunit M/transcription elongation factor TFIIS